jgi:hypothetical protein
MSPKRRKAMGGNGSIEFDPDRESVEEASVEYAGSGKDLEYALKKAAEDALGIGRDPGDTRPKRQPGDRLKVVRHEVVIANGHVSDHIVYIR